MNAAKTEAKDRPAREGFALDEALAALEAGKSVRQEFAGGRLHIDRPLPFRCLHVGAADTHTVARESAAAHASYLLVGCVEDAVKIVPPLADALRRRFGTFVLLDVDELERDRLLSEDAPFLQPFEVRLSATAGTSRRKPAAPGGSSRAKKAGCCTTMTSRRTCGAAMSISGSSA